MDDGETSDDGRYSVDMYRTLVEESNDVATIIDTDGTMRYVSPSVTRVLGYDPGELIGDTGYEYVHPDDRERNADAVEAVRRNPAEPQTVEVRFRRADGTWCWIEATLRNRLDDDTIEGILLNSREITERKQREQDLQELAGEYEALLHNAEDAIFLLAVDEADGDVTFTFERLSPAYERQTGITTGEVRGRTPRTVFGEDQGRDLEANYHRCMRAGEPISYQEELRVEEEPRVWQTKLAPVITEGAITRLVGITRDVTDRVERERRLRRQNERLDEFAGVISHDLRNPLNVAQSRATLLTEQVESDHTAPLLRALDRMEAIVEDTLTLAREGESIGDAESLRLSHVVGMSWSTVEADEATLDITGDVTVRGDPQRLQHVFENLFRNAVEHAGTDVTVRVGGLDDGGFYVEDDGPGIPAARHEEVFEAGSSSKRDGTGFGLSIVKRIVEAHGWRISLTTGTDGGARFEFELSTEDRAGFRR